MQITVTTPEEFFDQCGAFKETAEHINLMLRGHSLYKDRKIHKTNSITLLGYGFVPYKTSSYDGMWPLISMAPQKNSLNLYVMVYENGKPIIEQYKEVFGKSNIGKGCIRIKKFSGPRQVAVSDMIKVVAQHYEEAISQSE